MCCGGKKSACLLHKATEELAAGVVGPYLLQLGVVLQEEGEVLVGHVHFAVTALNNYITCERKIESRSQHCFHIFHSELTYTTSSLLN
jgi:hypothetical protein